MKIIKKTKRKPTRTKDPKKEAIFKSLSAILLRAGYEVRREELKQGHGWKASSGACRSLEQALIFVDRRLTQDEQISFLIGRILDSNIELTDAEIADLPKPVVSSLGLAEAA